MGIFVFRHFLAPRALFCFRCVTILLMKKLVVANWKMNPATAREAIALAKGVARAKGAEVVVCPPFLYLQAVSSHLKAQSSKPKAVLGVQDCFYEQKGAYTGEVSPAMLKNIGVKYVIIGHSERRALGETDDIIAKKVSAALRAGLTPILCVGEPLSVRKKGIAASKKFVATQLRKDLSLIRHSPFTIHHSPIIAYEPVWSISTNKGAKPDSPENATEMIAFIKHHSPFTIHHSPTRVLYGGSVNPKNAHGFLSRKEIDGALVGGASLNVRAFATIINISAQQSQK